MADLQFRLTDDLWHDMMTLEGASISAIVVWDQSMIDDALDEPLTPANRPFVDIDLYLTNQIKLELYGASIAIDEESDPIIGLDDIGETLAQHARHGAIIDEIASGPEEMLVLVLSNARQESLLVAVSAWMEDAWETLPEDAI
ncbi:MAG TPA: hypothetical protein EYP25_04085 [Anaerolineae bacterium]|nr:hypothetical protein [Caldilineae bacterium]HID33743.1 hypothetical protein [Anaerolineae bacterium]HIQ12590.1 hypothetical protein [Caldilineales bacterium]